jgi:methylphosphotriester-DNA--protein-cysteine methyltransferase
MDKPLLIKNAILFDSVREEFYKADILAEIEAPRMSVKDAASSVGYYSVRQLFRLFNSRLGMTPQQFREHSNTFHY